MQGQEVEWWSQGLKEEGMGNDCLMGPEFQFYKMKRVEETDGGDCCTAMRMC